MKTRYYLLNLSFEFICFIFKFFRPLFAFSPRQDARPDIAFGSKSKNRLEIYLNLIANKPKTQVLILILLFNFQVIEGVYLINLDEIPCELQRKAYQVLVTYDYPMNLALGPKESNQAAVLMREKLKSMDPALDCFWVPTSLFQLFVLGEYAKDPGFRGFVRSVETRSIHKVDDKILKCLQSKEIDQLHKLFYEINSGDEFFEGFMKINRAFVRWCRSQMSEEIALNDFVKKPSTLRKILERIPTDVIDWVDLEAPFARNNSEDFKSFVKLFEHSEIIFRVFEKEVEAELKNQFLIYRGAPFVYLKVNDKVESLIFLPWKGNKSASECFTLDKNALVSYSLSYGNSFLGGVFFSQEACAARYAYSDREHHIFHGVLLDYLEDSKSKDLFAIPTLHPFVEMLVSGELFHVHSKIAVDHYEGSSSSGFLNYSHIVDRTGFLITHKKTASQLGEELLSLRKIIFFNSDKGL